MTKYSVESIKNNTPTIIDLVLTLADYEKPLTFLPGQYATISFKKNGRYSAARCFSLAGSPNQQTKVEFGIRINGKYTKALTKLNVGDSVALDGPYGSFIFEPDIHKNIILCAGGIGITPFMSMIRYATELNLPNKISILVSARNKLEIPFHKELIALADVNPNLKTIIVIDGDDMPPNTGSQTYISGRINKQLLVDEAERLHNPTYFLCGPPPFMKAINGMLLANQVKPDSIITETFSQGQANKLGNTRNWPSTIYLAGAYGAIIASGLVMTAEILKSISPTLLPDILSNQQNKTTSSRQQDIDKIVNDLEKDINTANDSPGVIESNKALKQVNVIAPQQTQASPKPATTPTAAPATPAPKPPAPVCTTSASGVTVCQ